MALSNCSNTININYDIAQINSNEKTRSVTDSRYMCAGTNSSGRSFRVLIKFNLSHLPKNTQIISAVLTIDVASTASEFSPHKLKGYTLNSDWSSSTVNWNNQPLIDFNNKLFEKPVNKGQKYTFDLTEQCIKWYENLSNNYGLILLCSEDFNGSLIQICTDYASVSNLALNIVYFVEQEIHVVIEPTQFFQYSEDITVFAGEYFTSFRDISLMKTVTYFVKNNALVPINIVFEYSPDAINVMKEDRVITVNAQTNLILEPIWFSKYLRLSISKPYDGKAAVINTWLQLQE